ncbi:MAG: hypothetical protein PHU23_19315 [Dehalococcoidales bacterium]|nr:hypothetical protein [Dehalococcoidales bacterium]
METENNLSEPRLYPKYTVQKVDNGVYKADELLATDKNSVNSPFVLMPRKDPAAFAALVYYSTICEPRLGNEIRNWLRNVVQAPVAYGSQGNRNRIAMILNNLNSAV